MGPSLSWALSIFLSRSRTWWSVSRSGADTGRAPHWGPSAPAAGPARQPEPDHVLSKLVVFALHVALHVNDNACWFFSQRYWKPSHRFFVFFSPLSSSWVSSVLGAFVCMRQAGTWDCCTGTGLCRMHLPKHLLMQLFSVFMAVMWTSLGKEQPSFLGRTVTIPSRWHLVENDG